MDYARCMFFLDAFLFRVCVQWISVYNEDLLVSDLSCGELFESCRCK